MDYLGKSAERGIILASELPVTHHSQGGYNFDTDIPLGSSTPGDNVHDYSIDSPVPGLNLLIPASGSKPIAPSLHNTPSNFGSDISPEILDSSVSSQGTNQTIINLSPKDVTFTPEFQTVINLASPNEEVSLDHQKVVHLGFPDKAISPQLQGVVKLGNRHNDETSLDEHPVINLDTQKEGNSQELQTIVRLRNHTEGISLQNQTFIHLGYQDEGNSSKLQTIIHLGSEKEEISQAPQEIIRREHQHQGTDQVGFPGTNDVTEHLS